MRFIGCNLGHDTGVAVFDEEGNLDFYAESERFGSRIKSHFFNIDPIVEVFGNLRPEKDDIITFTSLNEESIVDDDYDDSLIRRGKFDYCIKDFKFKNNFVIDHHLSHAISTWCFREDNKEKLFLSYDGAGASTDHTLPCKSSLVGVINNKGFYKIPNAFNIPSSGPLTMILGNNSAGKAMGLAGYFHEVEPMQCSPDNLLKIFDASIDWRRGAMVRHICFEDKKDMKFVASFYKFMIEQIWNSVEKNIKEFAKGRGVLISGGTTLALELNTKIYNMTKNVTFGPPTNDSGLALGAAAFSFFNKMGFWPKPIKTPSLNALQENLPKIGPQRPKEIASKIHKNMIVGLLRGQAECGPRALGFRSLLASATDKQNLIRVSQKVKQREFYRPLAPMVTEESFDRYFVGPKGKYMQYKCNCTKESQKKLPAIVHRDKSARPQVVYKEDDPWLHELLVEYGKLSGHECLINTSLNGKNHPICNTYQDAKKDFEGKDIELISIETKKSKYAKPGANFFL